MKPGNWILIVEDNEQTAELTSAALDGGESRCQIVVVHDGDGALDCLYHRGKFDAEEYGNPLLVLLDLKMPKVSGAEVLTQIKSDKRLHSIPVVMFSSSCEAADVENCYRLGANAFVLKPIEFGKFTRTLQTVREFWTTINARPPAGLSAAPLCESQPAAAAGVE